MKRKGDEPSHEGAKKEKFENTVGMSLREEANKELKDHEKDFLGNVYIFS